MPKTDEPPMTKHSVRLYIGDLADLGALYPNVGANKALRVILRNHLRDKAEAAAKIQSEGAQNAPDINLDL